MNQMRFTTVYFVISIGLVVGTVGALLRLASLGCIFKLIALESGQVYPYIKYSY